MEAKNNSTTLPSEEYNPAERRNMAAKLWELLRRNTALRKTVEELKEKPRKLAGTLRNIDPQNPFAGLALRCHFGVRHGSMETGPKKPPSTETALMGTTEFPQVWSHPKWHKARFYFSDTRWLERARDLVKYSFDSTDLTLDTPWSETPLFFRHLFEWLWQAFEPGDDVVMPVDESFYPGPLGLGLSWMRRILR